MARFSPSLGAEQPLRYTRINTNYVARDMLLRVFETHSPITKLAISRYRMSVELMLVSYVICLVVVVWNSMILLYVFIRPT